MIVIEWLELELTYLEATVQPFNHYVMETPQVKIEQYVYFCHVFFGFSVLMANQRHGLSNGKTILVEEQSWYLAQLAGVSETMTASLQWNKTAPNVCPDYATKQSDG